MKQSLTGLATSIKDGRAQAANSIVERIASERKKKEEAILESFKSTFFDFIPMIEEEGIKISAHFKSAYEYKGSFIQFQKGDQLLRMDYQNAIQYRYEYTNPDRDTIGRSVYGTWPKEDLILYIYDELLSKIDKMD
jgi:hypothetical protein